MEENNTKPKKEWSAKKQALAFLAFATILISPFAIGYYIETKSDKFEELKFDLEMKILSHSHKFEEDSEEYKKLKQYEREVDYCKDKEEIHELERKALTL